MNKLLILLSIVIISCGQTREEMVKDSHSKISNIDLVYYSKDTITGLCFAHYSSHGFTCVPCDSLKNLK